MDDLISRQEALDEWNRLSERGRTEFDQVLMMLPSTQPKAYTKADYIMALHREYGCTLTRAEEAHQKTLEYLRNASMMKG